MRVIGQYGNWTVAQFWKGEVPFQEDRTGFLAVHNAEEFVSRETGEVRVFGDDHAYFESKEWCLAFVKNKRPFGSDHECAIRRTEQ